MVGLSGCASLTNGSFQNIKIVTTNNLDYESTNCVVINEEGQWIVPSDTKVRIGRDGNPLSISCNNKFQSGITSVEPKFDRQMLAHNLWLDLCIITCLVDAATNSFYSYPYVIDILMKKVNKNTN